MDQIQGQFGVVDYLVFIGVLAISAGIGIYFGCFGSKQRSAEEYLMANRQMSAYPVALSLMCSFISAIVFLGIPVEIYFFGGQFALFAFTFIPVTVALLYFYVPVYFNLQVTSAYQYLELRFSKKTRMLVSFLGIFNLVFYMAVIVLGPSIAIEQVTGLNNRVMSVVVLIVCIFYSTIGGLKTVLWSDAFQGILMIGSILAIVIKGVTDVGGWCTVWTRAEYGGRTNLFNFDLDPRTRYTFWSVVMGGFFTLLPIHATSQGQVQRYVSLPSFAKCKKALLISMFGQIILLGLAMMSGYAIFAKYHDCDPIRTKKVSRPDQLVPLYVMESFAEVPGLTGIFVAGITGATLSTVSSGLNAVSAVITFDFVKKRRPDYSEEKLSFISKFISLLVGTIVFCLVFVVENMGGILQAATSILNTLGGPVLGIFTLGMFFPWANTKGSVVGMLMSLLLTAVYAVGVFIAGSQKLLPNQVLPLSKDGCPIDPNVNITNMTPISNETSVLMALSWKEKSNQDTYLIQLLSVSYFWQPVMGFSMTIVFGLILSYLFSRSFFVKWFNERRWNRKDDYRQIKAVKAELISPPMLRLWEYLFPKGIKKWVILPDTPLENHFNTLVDSAKLLKEQLPIEMNETDEKLELQKTLEADF